MVIIIFRFTNRVNKVTSINIINKNVIDIRVAVLILLADFTDSHFMPADDDVKGSREFCDERSVLVSSRTYAISINSWGYFIHVSAKSVREKLM